MKNYVILILFCAISIIFIPVALVGNDVNTKDAVTSTSYVTEAQTTQPVKKQETISVFRTTSDSTDEITLFEYVCGSVAAEMPLAYHEEALKAQAIICYTNALREKQSGNSEKGDISDNTAVHQGYIDKEQRKEKWGKDFEKYEKKLQNAVKAVDHAATKGLLPKNTAARKKSSLTLQLNKLA
jgi:stage II sporulation protein D